MQGVFSINIVILKTAVKNFVLNVSIKSYIYLYITIYIYAGMSFMDLLGYAGRERRLPSNFFLLPFLSQLPYVPEIVLEVIFST